MRWSMFNFHFRYVIFAFIFCMFVVSCEDGSASSRRASKRTRIVSLSPAITQMIIDLDRGDLLVGVGAFDPVKPADVTVVGDLHNIDYEKLLSVQPTDIFIQKAPSQLPEKLQSMSDRLGWKIHQYEIETITDVLNTLSSGSHTQASQSVGAVLKVPMGALGLRLEIMSRLEELSAITISQSRPRVLLLIGLNPITAVGPDTFLHEMLVIVGGKNVMTNASSRYPVIDKEKLLSLNPDVIVLLSDVVNNSGEDVLHGSLAGLNIPAVKNNRVVYLDDTRAALPSTSVHYTAGKLAKLLHPTLADQVDKLFAEDDQTENKLKKSDR